jgi:AraC-like DNA-binding protein
MTSIRAGGHDRPTLCHCDAVLLTPESSYAPICEPVTLAPGEFVRVRRVTWPAGSRGLDRFLHFHDVAEIVVFDRVQGEFHCGAVHAAIDNRSIVYAPPMVPHDFVLNPGAKAWTLVQFDVIALRAAGKGLSLTWPKHPVSAPQPSQAAARLRMLADWLLEMVRQNAGVTDKLAVASLMLSLLGAMAPTESDADRQDPAPPGHRVQPALQRLHEQPGAALPIETAASLCSLSPAYFSRLFRRCHGMPFRDYVRVHRLQLAAQRLADDRENLSQISYALGFASPSHFSACFRQRFGVTPRAYRTGARRLIPVR